MRDGGWFTEMKNKVEDEDGRREKKVQSGKPRTQNLAEMDFHLRQFDCNKIQTLYFYFLLTKIK